MTKKIFGIILFVIAALLLLGSVATMLSNGINSEEISAFTVALFTVALFVCDGIFLFTFDSVYKRNAIDGFKFRSRVQRPFLIVAVCIHGVLSFVAAFSAGLLISSAQNLAFGLVLGFFTLLPYIFPLILFVIIMLMYSTPHANSKKYFIKNAEQLNFYLSDVSVYKPVTADNFVMVSDKALFFPKQFCVIPFDQIESVKLVKQLWEKDVFFYLTNGKKFYIMTKHFDAINEAIEAHKKNRF